MNSINTASVTGIDLPWPALHLPVFTTTCDRQSFLLAATAVQDALFMDLEDVAVQVRSYVDAVTSTLPPLVAGMVRLATINYACAFGANPAVSELLRRLSLEITTSMATLTFRPIVVRFPLMSIDFFEQGLASALPVRVCRLTGSSAYLRKHLTPEAASKVHGYVRTSATMVLELRARTRKPFFESGLFETASSSDSGSSGSAGSSEATLPTSLPAALPLSAAPETPSA